MYGKFALLIIVVLLAVRISLAQNNNPAGGLQQFSTRAGGAIDSLDLATSNVLLNIPIRSKSGKIPFSYSLVGNYGAFVWTFLNHGAPVKNWMTQDNLAMTGRVVSSPMLSARLYESQTTITCGTNKNDIKESGFYIVDAMGATHTFNNPPIDNSPANGAVATPCHPSVQLRTVLATLCI